MSCYDKYFFSQHFTFSESLFSSYDGRKKKIENMNFEKKSKESRR